MNICFNHLNPLWLESHAHFFPQKHLFIIYLICCLSLDDLQSFKSHKISARFICRIKKLANRIEWIGMVVVCEDKNWFSVSSCIEFNEFPLFMKCKIKGEEKSFHGDLLRVTKLIVSLIRSHASVTTISNRCYPQRTFI